MYQYPTFQAILSMHRFYPSEAGIMRLSGSYKNDFLTITDYYQNEMKVRMEFFDHSRIHNGDTVINFVLKRHGYAYMPWIENEVYDWGKIPPASEYHMELFEDIFQQIIYYDNKVFDEIFKMNFADYRTKQLALLNVV